MSALASPATKGVTPTAKATFRAVMDSRRADGRRLSLDDAMAISAGLALLGGIVAFATVRTGAAVATPTQPTVAAQPCGDPCLDEEARAA